MPLHPPSAPQTPRDWRPAAPVPLPQVPPGQKSRRPQFLLWLDQFWYRVTEGLELSQLWKQFKTDAQQSYRFYQRDFDARAPQETRRHNVFNTAQEFAWAILEKLTPARRVLLLLAVLLLIFGGIGFHYTDPSGHTRGFEFDMRLQAGALLFLLLMLEVADRVVMKRDLEIARDIQSWLLPSKPPQVPGLEMAFATRPANTVAGDYYDVFPRPVSGESSFIIAVADVAGKSIPAALLMATFQASLKTLSSTPCSLQALTAGMNQYACTNSQEGLRFTTAFLAEYDTASRILTYINAGHNVPILRRLSGAIERLTNGGLPLGIQAEARYETGAVVLQSGDWLMIFTDGLVEAENHVAEEFGEPPLLEILQASSAATPDELLRRIMTRLDTFVGETPQHDDVTCLLVKVV
jgi:phosphoserine phosphatase RsbU/P